MPFIVLEGLDGAGKTTQLERLCAMLAERGIAYEFLHFPRYDSPVYGEMIARFLRGELGTIDTVDPYLVALLFAGDRADAAPMMREWLAEGKFVVTDRYVYSNIAFQCAKLDKREDGEKLRDWIMDLEFGYNNLPRPDISIFLDVPFQFTMDRLSGTRGGSDRDYLCGAEDIHEQSLELQSRVREVYRRCAASDDTLHLVDCSDGQGKMDTPENNFGKISRLLLPLLP